MEFQIRLYDPIRGFHWVTCRIDLHEWGDKSIFPNCDLVIIQKDTIGIDEGIFPDRNMLTIITVEGCFDPYPRAFESKQFIE